MVGNDRVYWYDGVVLCLALVMCICVMELTYVLQWRCLFVRLLMFGNGCVCLCDGVEWYSAVAVYICSMKFAYVWQWPCMFVGWNWLMFGIMQRSLQTFAKACVYLCDGVGLFLAMFVYICAMEMAFIWQQPCIICVMELAFVWQWRSIFVRWNWLMFYNGCVYLCNAVGLCLAMTAYVCVMKLASVWQWLCIFVRWRWLMFSDGRAYLCDGIGLCLTMT